eukprot:4304377-Alexandrium_andersonii.AAC.1
MGLSRRRLVSRATRPRAACPLATCVLPRVHVVARCPRRACAVAGVPRVPLPSSRARGCARTACD